jgi:3-oxoacyl-[acyl-carrier protein] reductase
MIDRPVAIVTGAARGLGRAIAERLSGEGYRIALADIDGAGAEAGARAIGGSGGEARAFQLDVASGQQVREVFAAIAEALGTPIALVSNAGIYPDDAVLEMSEASWDRVLGVNLKGSFLCAQAFAKARVAAGGGGAIVNLASTAAFSARIGAAHYAASKAGIVMLTKSLALELGPQGIRVNAVAPGLIEVAGERVTAEYKANYLAMIPRGRVGAPEDIADAVAFLLSDKADFISGACLPVDGGFLTGRKLIRAGSQ